MSHGSHFVLVLRPTSSGAGLSCGHDVLLCVFFFCADTLLLRAGCSLSKEARRLAAVCIEAIASVMANEICCAEKRFEIVTWETRKVCLSTQNEMGSGVPARPDDVLLRGRNVIIIRGQAAPSVSLN